MALYSVLVVTICDLYRRRFHKSRKLQHRNPSSKSFRSLGSQPVTKFHRMVLSPERLECIRELVVEVMRRLTSGQPISSVWWSRMMHILSLVAGDPSGKFAIPHLSASCRKAVEARLAQCQRSSAHITKETDWEQRQELHQGVYRCTARNGYCFTQCGKQWVFRRFGGV
jgi:hypothetical protein